MAPALSVAIAAWGPPVLHEIVFLCGHFAGYAKNRYAIQQIRGFLKKQEKRLDDPGLSPSHRAEIESKISRAEASIDNHEYEWVSLYLRGDGSSGLREATGAESEASEDIRHPPGGGGTG